MNGYHLAETAASDLAHIRNYLRRRGGEQPAGRMIARLRGIFELLSQQPNIGVGSPYLPGLRSFPVPRTNYVVLYFPERDPIEIYRVVHGSQDIEQLFQ